MSNERAGKPKKTEEQQNGKGTHKGIDWNEGYSLDYYCVGIVISPQFWQGEIIKVNKKSFIVRLNHYRKTFGKRVEIDRAVCSEIKYTFVKTLSNGKDWYRSEGSLYGSIDL